VFVFFTAGYSVNLYTDNWALLFYHFKLEGHLYSN
jgi:hypothetical protein